MEKYPCEVIRLLYDGRETSSAKTVQGIASEQEYLYWTNDSHLDGHGGVHKAFTEPFVRAEPFQTYEIQDVDKAADITTNANYLFFVGQQARKSGLSDRMPELFI